MSRRIDRNNAVLLVIDMQRKLLPHIDDHAPVEQNVIRLIHGVDTLGVPVIVTEQYPQGIGHTTDGVLEALEQTRGPEAIQKMTFSSCGATAFVERIETLGRRQVILAGIETHVCVYQTAFDLRRDGHQVALAADAVSSCRATDRALGLDRMRELGVQVMGAQMIMFEVVARAGTPEFKQVAPLLRTVD